MENRMRECSSDLQKRAIVLHLVANLVLKENSRQHTLQNDKILKGPFV